MGRPVRVQDDQTPQMWGLGLTPVPSFTVTLLLLHRSPCGSEGLGVEDLALIP